MKTTFTLALFLYVNFCMAQHAGNQLYQNDNSYGRNQNETIHNVQADKTTSDGSTVVYKLNILNNVQADSYLITLGLNEEATTPKDCNIKINKRIAEFKSAIKKMGISDNDIYTDFISQTKIYDYKSEVNGKQSTSVQEEKGFEIKKNLIIRIGKISIFDDLIETASVYDIYNIVKVDYFNANPQQTYDLMLAEANKLLEARKTQMEKTSNPELLSEPQIDINYYSIQPGDQYKNYTAYESSDVSYYRSYNSDATFIKQEQRKSKTFYYDSQKPDFYDKIINSDTPVVGLQYVMEVTVTYTKR